MFISRNHNEVVVEKIRKAPQTHLFRGSFIPIAEETDTKNAICHFPLTSKAANVVARALSDSILELPVSTPGPICFVHRIAAKSSLLKL